MPAYWLCLQQPIQIGGVKKDHNIIKALSPKTKIHPEYFHSNKRSSQLNLILNSCPFPVDNDIIIIEGTDGIMDAINYQEHIIDVIKKLQTKSAFSH